jgi:hypothetical protein
MRSLVGLAVGVSLAMGFGQLPVAAADTGGPFVDVPLSSTFSHEISWLAQQGVTQGWPDGTFRPLLSITRDAMAAFMYRLAGSPDYVPPVVSPFTDVSTSNQFYREISWLADQGISTGWSTPSGREYRPLQSITRDAMAAFLYRFAGSPSYAPTGSSPFTDVGVSTAFATEIRWLAAQGISTGWNLGYGCLEYRPYAAVARDAMAAFMYRHVNGGTAPVVASTCSPPPPPPPPPSQVYANYVTAGAYCKWDYFGWHGYTKLGKLMVCTTTPGDTAQPRWRAV